MILIHSIDVAVRHFFPHICLPMGIRNGHMRANCPALKPLYHRSKWAREWRRRKRGLISHYHTDIMIAIFDQATFSAIERRSRRLFAVVTCLYGRAASVATVHLSSVKASRSAAAVAGMQLHVVYVVRRLLWDDSDKSMCRLRWQFRVLPTPNLYWRG